MSILPVSKFSWSIKFNDETTTGEGSIRVADQESALIESMGIMTQQIDAILQKLKRKQENAAK